MSIWLVMKTADGGERPFPVRQRVVIGRESRCQVRIALPTVCKQHCELRVVDGELHLNDLESANGTFHNGNRVDKAVLVHKDIVKIGPVMFQVRFGSEAEVTSIETSVDEAADVPEVNVIARRNRSEKAN